MIGCIRTVGTNLIHGKKMRDFTLEFLNHARFHVRVFKMCQISPKIHGRSLRNSRKIHGPTAIISRCYVNAN